MIVKKNDGFILPLNDERDDKFVLLCNCEEQQ